LHARATKRAQALDLRQRLQPLPGEALGQQRQELHDGGPASELVIGGVQEPLDRLGGEDPGELGLQLRCGLPQRDLLIEGDAGCAVGFSHRGSPVRRV